MLSLSQALFSSSLPELGARPCGRTALSTTVVIFIKKVSFGLLASILLRAFTSLNQPITRRAIVIYCYDAPRTRTLLIEGATIFSVPTSAVKREFQKNFVENKKKTKKLEQENKGKLPGTFRESQGK